MQLLWQLAQDLYFPQQDVRLLPFPRRIAATKNRKAFKLLLDKPDALIAVGIFNQTIHN
jgi:hypothetical protein